MTQPIEMTYVAIRAADESDSIALKATVLPILMSEIIKVKRTVKMTELTGTLHVSWT